MAIDAHMHFWKYDPVEYDWIGDSMKKLQRDFLPGDIEKTLEQENIEGVVAVQACQTEGENEFLKDLGEKYDFIKGIVGWVDLRSPDLEKRLAYFSQFKKIKGFRHVVQGEPPGFLLQKEFIRGINMLLDAGFVYDILVYHHQLDDVLKFQQVFPGKNFILDHCAKPNIAGRDITEWSIKMREAASHQLTFCKLSGLLTEANWGQWSANDIFPYFDVIFEAFGPGRVVFGSDWPVVLESGEYHQWKELVTQYVCKNCPANEEDVFHNNAVHFYNL